MTSLTELKRGGFTLIELLIVIAIILILIAIALPNFLSAQIRARVVETQANQRTVVTALESYRIDYQSYVPMYAYGGDLRWNDYEPYNWLTTPVAYLTSTEAMNDPCAYGSEGYYRGNDLDQKFEYTPRKYGQGTKVPARHRLSADMFSLEGTGPDAEDSIQGSADFPGRPNNFAPYEATNGLRSNGDIYVTGGVGIPDWIRRKQ